MLPRFRVTGSKDTPTHAPPGLSKNALVLYPGVARVIDSNQRLLSP